MTAHEPDRMDPVGPDEFDLELQAAGEPVDPEVARLLAQDPALAPARIEIQAMRSWWEHYRPPLPAAPPKRAAWRWAAPLVALAAVALVLVAWPRPPAFEARGPVAVDVWRTHDGAAVDATAPYRAGDQLGLALVPDQTRYLSVAALQDDGGVSPLLVGREVRAGSRFELPGIALDDYRGREWLVVLATPQRIGEDQLADEVDGLLPAPSVGPGRWVVEITRERPAP